MITKFTIANFKRLDHPATLYLAEQVAVKYLGTNGPQEACDHFHGLRVAKTDLVGFALLERINPYRDVVKQGKFAAPKP
ncbi:MAG: hypothetical protein SNJ84_03840 [Verrucomicrobiia bacterium]